MPLRRTQKITLPALSFKERTRAFVQILTEMHKSDRVEKKDDNRQPATTCRCINLEDGKEYILICPAMMVGCLRDAGVEYINHYYDINVTADKLPGKDYKGVEVFEIDKPDNIPMKPEDMAPANTDG